MKVIVKPNKKQTKIISYNKEDNTYIIEVKGRPINNGVNIELIKFLSKHFKTNNIKIVKGLKSKEKIINIGQKDKFIFFFVLST
ncbi:DUF167 domain-containing protein [Candidatus Woesearchaeota archaeon]|nr:DUF167 domain-containing protein [Candidatus Woesearchaeota archaeon]